MEAVTPAVFYNHAPEEMQESEEKYRELAGHTGILEFDIKTRRIVSVNDAVCSITGYSREELLGMDPMELLADADKGFFTDRFGKWQGGKEPEHGADYRVKSKAGREIYAAVNVSLLKDQNGLPQSLMAVAHDITKRKKMEDTLRLSGEKHHDIFNSHEEGFCVIDVLFDGAGRAYDWQYLETNTAFEKQSGFTDANGKRISELKPETESYWFEFYGQAAQSGNPARTEKEFKASGRWFEVHAFKIGGEESHKLAVFFYDISARKKRERLIHALVRKLRQSDRNKNEFLNILSHELRNPLAAITAGVDLMDMHDAESLEMAKEIIKHQAGHLSRLVDELLDLTRITHNKILLKAEETDLNTLARDLARDYRSLFEKKGITFETRIENAPLLLLADPVRMMQTICNLLSNALKFTPEGGKVSLTIRDKDTAAEICVKDNGIGIENDLLPKIFEPFVQAGHSVVRSEGGLGLGLAIAKKIALLHGGDVLVKSDGPGKGSEFTICLPVKNAARKKSEERDKEKCERKLRLLLIEDNRDFSEILCAMFQALGHETEQAFDGEDGILKAVNTQPDAIFCDIGLPDMDGLTVAKAIRNNGGIKRILLIALTGYAGTDDLKRAIEAGFDRYVAKPVNLNMLQEILAWINQI